MKQIQIKINGEWENVFEISAKEDYYNKEDYHRIEDIRLVDDEQKEESNLYPHQFEQGLTGDFCVCGGPKYSKIHQVNDEPEQIEDECEHQFVSYVDNKHQSPFICILCGQKRLVGHGGIILVYDNKTDDYEELKERNK